MNRLSGILKAAAAVLVFVAVVGAFLFLQDREKRYDFTEKSFISMDTVVSEKIYGDDSSVYIKPVFDLVTVLDDTISRFDKDSEVYRLNTTGKTSEKAVYHIINSILPVSEASQGAFDVTVGEVSDLWSIGKESERIPSENELTQALSAVDYKNIGYDGESVTLSGGVVDLGAVGKGYACDLIAAYLSSMGCKGAVVSVGGSILAYGDYNKKGDKWSIAVRHPRNENEYLGVVRLDEGFVSTSGDYERYFEKDGKRYHHIFDARTGMPASSGLISVTVVAESGILSDALSTACFILGETEGKALVEKFGASAIFVDEEMNVTTVGEIDFEKQ